MKLLAIVLAASLFGGGCMAVRPTTPEACEANARTYELACKLELAIERSVRDAGPDAP